MQNNRQHQRKWFEKTRANSAGAGAGANDSHGNSQPITAGQLGFAYALRDEKNNLAEKRWNESKNAPERYRFVASPQRPPVSLQSIARNAAAAKRSHQQANLLPTRVEPTKTASNPKTPSEMTTPVVPTNTKSTLHQSDQNYGQSIENSLGTVTKQNASLHSNELHDLQRLPRSNQSAKSPQQSVASARHEFMDVDDGGGADADDDDDDAFLADLDVDALVEQRNKTMPSPPKGNAPSFQNGSGQFNYGGQNQYSPGDNDKNNLGGGYVRASALHERQSFESTSPFASAKRDSFGVASDGGYDHQGYQQQDQVQPYAPQDSGFGAGDDPSVPNCSGHNLPCRMFTATTGNNNGRAFYKCPLQGNDRCEFFEWADGNDGNWNDSNDNMTGGIGGLGNSEGSVLDVREQNRRKFGHSTFRKGQGEVIEQAMQGRDVFVLMPTGGGKSLCYQLPAYCCPGLAVVISPLLSLIQDQVQSLTKLGVESVFLSSAQDYETEQRDITRRLNRTGQHDGIKLLYITPEKLRHSEMIKNILKSLHNKRLLSRFVVDEAHCLR